MLPWILVFSGVTALAASVFVGAAVMWLRRLRETVAAAMAENAERQAHAAQKMGEAVAQLQKQQRTSEQQLHNLAQAGMRLRQDLASVSNRLEHGNADTSRGDRTVH